MSRFIIKIFLLAIMLFSRSALSWETEAINLLNQGKASKAIKLYEEKILELSGEKKIRAIYSMADACFLIDSEICIVDLINKHYEDLTKHSEEIRKNSLIDKRIWLEYVDANVALYLFAVSNSANEKDMKDSLQWENDMNTGSQYSMHGALKLIARSRIASYLGERVNAETQLRRARALVLNKDISLISSQIATAAMLETSLYHLQDAQDVARWYRSAQAAVRNYDKSFLTYVNPYAYLRVLLTIYDAGILSEGEEKPLVNELHEFFSQIDIPKNTKLSRRKELFYADLALNKTLNNFSYSFDPIDILNSIDLEYIAAIGIKTFISIENGKSNIDELKKVLPGLEKHFLIADERTKLHLSPLINILNSLIYKSEKSPKEFIFLEKYVNSQLDFFASSGRKVGDAGPIFNRQNYTIGLYVVKRLLAHDPKSLSAAKMALMLIQSHDSSTSGQEQAAYELISNTGNELERQQALRYVSSRERYSYVVRNAYFQSVASLEKNWTSNDPSQKKFINPDDQIQLMDLLTKGNSQLQKIRSRKSQLLTFDPMVIQKALKSGELVVFVAEIQSETLVVSIDTKAIRASSFNKSENSIENAHEILKSSSLERFEKSLIKDSSKIYSRNIFLPGSLNEINSIYFLNGGVVAGIPYTLLTNPDSGRWLIEEQSIFAFQSAVQFLSKKNTNTRNSYTRASNFVGFANPLLRSVREGFEIAKTESLIRGTSGNQVSDLVELPETELEANRFAQNLGGNSKVFSGEGATPQNLLMTNLNETEILMFSTHGVMAGELDGVMSPSLVLTPQKNSGLVTAESLFALRGSPEAVILSTCNSSTKSALLDRSEIASLSSAFLLKGSNAVVSSMWAVNSAATLDLMTKFSDGIKNSKSFSSALREAQIQLIQSDDKNHPSSWAGFILVGDYDRGRGEALSLHKKKYSDSDSFGWASAKAGLYLQYFDFNKKKNHIEVFDKNFDKKIGDLSNLVESAQDVKTFSDLTGVFLSVRQKNNFEIYAIRDVTKAHLLCVINIEENWLIESFISLSSYAAATFRRELDSKSVASHEVALVKVDLKTCQFFGQVAKTFARGTKKLTAVYPLGRSGDLIFTYAEDVASAERWVGGVTEMNTEIQCNYRSTTHFDVFDPALKLSSSGTQANLHLPHRYSEYTESIPLVFLDPCRAETKVRQVSLDEFRKTRLLGDGLGVASRLGYSAAEKNVNSNFSYVIDWSMDVSGDLVVFGTPSNVSHLFKNLYEESISEADRKLLQVGDAGVFVYKHRSASWVKLFDVDECIFLSALVSSKGVLGTCSAPTQSNSPSPSFLRFGFFPSQ
jgi:CHAT domain-containing protein